MPLIACRKLDGSTIMIEKESLIIRPAALAIIINNNKLLLTKMIATGKYHLPGGGIEKGEKIEDALKREVLEETGISIKVCDFITLKELYFYYDPSGKAYHGFHFYYHCAPLTTDIIPDNLIKDDAVEQPGWMPIKNLKSDEFQVDGEMILDIINKITDSS